ncbi:MAG: SPOR domain-containing protein [bacterium]|nr:SPOR domain-containing protein [bacterium]
MRWQYISLIALLSFVLLTAGTCERRGGDGGVTTEGDDGNIVEGSEVVGEIVPADSDVSEDIFGMTEEGDGDFITEVSGDIETDTTDVISSGSLVSGFRVQVFASGYEDNAENVAGEVRAKLPGENVYVENISNMWKVRVGDCADRSEAESLRSRLSGAGYGDAWIVKDTVRTQ